MDLNKKKLTRLPLENFAKQCRVKRAKPFEFWSLFRSTRAQIIKNVVYKCSKCICFLNWGMQRNVCG